MNTELITDMDGEESDGVEGIKTEEEAVVVCGGDADTIVGETITTEGSSICTDIGPEGVKRGSGSWDEEVLQGQPSIHY